MREFGLAVGCLWLALHCAAGLSHELPVAVEDGSFSGSDCNANGIPDATDISSGASLDCDGNGEPDECDVAVAFVPHVVTMAIMAPQTAAIADLDGDGDPDLLSASFNDDRIAWYQNVGGEGAFFGPLLIDINALGAVSVIAADVDGDGDQDVMATAAIGGKVTWYANQGAGVFGPPRTITALAAGAWAVRAADVDRDGDLDAVSVSQEDNKVAWYENLTGAGFFGPQRLITTATDKPLAVVAEDLDGDDDVDVAAASFADDKVRWLENSDGDGTFGPGQLLSDQQAGATALVSGDIDGDGDLDLVSGAQFSGVVAWFEKIDGVDNFGPPQTIGAGLFQLLSVAVADLDRDGDADVLAVAFGSNSLLWYENDGLGGFGPPRTISGSLQGPNWVTTGDLDGDGDIDAVVTSQNDNRLTWFENTSDDCDGDLIPDACQPDCDSDGLPDGCELTSGQAADCNDNGLPDDCDIAAGSVDCTGNGIPDICEPDCNGNLIADSCDIAAGSDDCAGEGIPDECEPDCNDSRMADSCDILSGASVDCANDGIPDECEPDCNGNLIADSCDLRSGVSKDCDASGIPDECEAGISAPDCNANQIPDVCETRTLFTSHLVSTAANFPRSVAGADLDGDGDFDLVSASGLDNKIAWYPNEDGLGGFGPQQIVSTSGLYPLDVHLTDIDGDFDIDVLSASYSDDEISLYRNVDGRGSFAPQLIVAADVNGALAVHSGDIDGDGARDVISASHLDGELRWHRNLGSSFAPGAIVADGLDKPISVHAVDLDGDGDLDVASASLGNAQLLWFENLDGAGEFAPAVVVSGTALGISSVFAIDLDGDGDQDLMSASQQDDKLAWYENLDGAGSFSGARVVSATANGATSVFASDLDGNGWVDLLSASFFDNGVSWYRALDGQGAFSEALPIGQVAVGSYDVVAADIDGDGDIDVAGVSQDDDSVRWYENTGNDCNGNQVPDGCDIASATSADCTGNEIPDECEADCNGNAVADSCDLLSGGSDDCNGNAVPDECEPDCNGNGMADSCDLAGGGSDDCNSNGLPDECDPDCNENGMPDACDIAEGDEDDCDLNGVPDPCDPDCNDSGFPDPCDVDQGTSEDCDLNGYPDECDPDCNGDGVPNACEGDCNDNSIADGCEPDCNGNGNPDDCDVVSGVSVDCNANGSPDECDTACQSGCDSDGDRCRDALDLFPEDGTKCADTDADQCDDCSSGIFNPSNDGTDLDLDGTCAVGDCDDDNVGVWSPPQPVQGMLAQRAGASVKLTWSEPAAPGATFPFYDTLRSSLAQDFFVPATCVESEEFDLASSDPVVPASGEPFFYLIRVKNACPAETLGSDSSGAPRDGRECSP